MPNWCYAFILGVCVIILMLMLQPSGGIIEAVGEDFDGDGFTDLYESGQPLCDGVRNQDPWDAGGTDTTVDDGCPGIAQVGTFSEAAFNIGTAADRRCGNYAGSVSGAWPSDLSTSGPSVDKITITDTSSFIAPIRRLDKKPSDPEYDKRWDLQPGPNSGGDNGNWITTIDLAFVTNHFPPMAPFYGTIKSFGGPPCIRHEYQPTLPAQGAFFYPWFPGTWAKSSIGRPCTDQVAPHNCYTVYDPTLGFYDSETPAIIDAQLDLMKKSHLDFGVMSWFPERDTDAYNVMEYAARPASPHLSMRWALYYEPEGSSNPAVGDVSTPGTLIYDINHIYNYHMGLENYLTQPDPVLPAPSPVIFVYGGSETCEMADRWKAVKDWLLGDAETNLYVVLKVFPGYASCTNQPDAWHQYGPDTAVHNFAPSSTTISPGYSQIDFPISDVSARRSPGPPQCHAIHSSG